MRWAQEVMAVLLVSRSASVLHTRTTLTPRAVTAYVGVVLYRWQKRFREYLRSREIGETASGGEGAGRARGCACLPPVRWSRVAVFTSGLVLGVGVTAAGYGLRRYRYPNPERVFTTVLPMLRANNEVGGGREGERVLNLTPCHRCGRLSGLP